VGARRRPGRPARAGTLGLTSKDGSGRGPVAPCVMLPKDLKAAPFTGRKDELQAIDQAFADRDQAQVFVLFGSPGVGKSRLAHEYATRHLARYPGGTFFHAATGRADSRGSGCSEEGVGGAVDAADTEEASTRSIASVRARCSAGSCNRAATSSQDVKKGANYC
jgi:hypothetical protein